VDEPRVVIDASSSDDFQRYASVYGSSAYGRATAGASGGTWLAVVADGWRLSLILRGEADSRDAVSPLGYSGLFIGERHDAARAEALWLATKRLLADDLGVVSMFLRFPPFAPQQARRARDLSGLVVRRAADTVLVATSSEGEMWARMAPSARRQVRKAERFGLTSDIVPFDSTMIAQFRRLYDPTMERLGAEAHLRFKDEYYTTLADGLGERLLVASVRDDEEHVASCLLMDDGQFLHYHLAGSTPRGAARGANNLMIWSALRAASGAGRDGLHLGGGRPSLLRFKMTFGGQFVPFEIGSAIVDEPRYSSLVLRRARELGTTPSELEATGYFPAFRATPVPGAAVGAGQALR